MSSAVISLGSNAPDGYTILTRVMDDLAPMTVKASGLYSDGGYYNAVLQLTVSVSRDKLVETFKRMEREAGRLPDSRLTGKVPLDIDVVIFDGGICRPDDFSQPYFQRGYSQLLDK